MQLGLIGLGKMGKNMALRLARDGHEVVVYNRTTRKAFDLEKESDRIRAVKTLDELVNELSTPRHVWVMLPAGDPVDEMIAKLLEILEVDDVIIDGGNSNYQQTLERARSIGAKGLKMVDIGTSGGIWGLEQGYAMMVGGESKVVSGLKPALETLAPGPERGWGHVGPVGAGHFVKMVHNGIEYGIMQAYAEGFDILNSKEQFDLDLHQVAEIWRYGSVIRSWLLDLIADALQQDQVLDEIEGWVDDSGEGRWTVLEAIAQDVPAPVISLALLMRLASRREESYANKLLAVMRNQFGGHEVKEESATG